MTACLDDEPLGNVINVGPDEEVITINQLSEKICELTNFKASENQINQTQDTGISDLARQPYY